MTMTPESLKHALIVRGTKLDTAAVKLIMSLENALDDALAKERHFQGRPRKLNATQIISIALEYQAGKTTTYLSDIYNISPRCLTRTLKRCGIAMRARGKPARILPARL